MKPRACRFGVRVTRLGDVQVDGAVKPPGGLTAADLDELRTLLVIEDLHLFPDQLHRGLEEAPLDGHGSVLVDPAPDGLSEVVSQITRGRAQALHA